MVLWLVLAIVLPLVIPSLLLIPPMWKLCARAGFPRWFSLAMIIPLANLTLLYFIAFSQWPSELRGPKVGPSGGKPRPEDPPAPATAISGSARRDGL